MGPTRTFWRNNHVLYKWLILVAAFFGFSGWATIKAAAAFFNTNFDVSGTLLSWDWWTTDVLAIPFGHIFFLCVIVGVSCNLAFSIRNRNKPFTILQTDITLTFENGGARVTNTRRQTLHANRPDIAAYFLSLSHDAPNARFSPDAHGKEVTAWLEHPDPTILAPRVRGTGSQRDVDVLYKQPLHYGWLMTLIPRWLMSVCRRYLVVQGITYVSLNEYDRDDCCFGLHTTKYSHHKITITLDFSGDSGPRPFAATDIDVYRRFVNAVSEHVAIPGGAPGVFRIDVANGMSRDESILITWKRRATPPPAQTPAV